ncbi:hypothetical protein [Myroides sp.]|uniref:hypothetical protein n=1 Tax=Myroides sp. TaxID=1874736 RepID=UPI003F30084A
MKYRIEIPEPCHEDWNLMIPQEKGRHCTVCDKVVMDFTTSTKDEFVEEVINNEDICTRVPLAFLGQLPKPVIQETGVRFRGLVVTMINLLAFTTISHVDARETLPKNIIESRDQVKPGVGMGMPKKISGELTGTVISEGDEIKEVFVFFSREEHKVVLDDQGRFTIVLHWQANFIDKTCIFRKRGYEDVVVELKTKYDEPLKIVMRPKVIDGSTSKEKINL